MITVSGSAPSLSLLGEAVKLHDVPWMERSEGWDWRSPENLAYWSSLTFECWENGEWIGIEPEKVFPRMGFAQFPRSLSSSAVRASGTCHPIGQWGSAGSRWELKIETRVVANNVIGDSDLATRGIVGDSTATLEGMGDVWPTFGPVMAVLPSWSGGSFVGLGQMMAGSDSITIVFNEEGVVHEPC